MEPLGSQTERLDSLPPGIVLHGFRLETVLGSGGFGIVYRAVHLDTGIVFAIKEYLPSELAIRRGMNVHPRGRQYQGPFMDGLQRFRDEARHLMKIDPHSNIVDCRYFFSANNTAYLVMEYINGVPLSKLLVTRNHENRPFQEHELLAVMVPIIEGVAHLHSVGILHRDIKPANILIRRDDERPVLIDFGAAKQGVADHSKSVAPFTPGFAAPEQIIEGTLGTWTDIYGLGATMWQIVAGGAGTSQDRVCKLVNAEKRLYVIGRGSDDPLQSAIELGTHRFSPSILDSIDQCMRLQESERILNCNELLQCLRTPATFPNENSNQMGDRRSHFRSAIMAKIETVRWGWIKRVTSAIVPILIAIFVASILFIIPVYIFETSSTNSTKLNDQELNPRDTPSYNSTKNQSSEYSRKKPENTARRNSLNVSSEQSSIENQSVKNTDEVDSISTNSNNKESTSHHNLPSNSTKNQGSKFSKEGPENTAEKLDSRLFIVGGAVSSPQLLVKVEPEYSEQAKYLKVEGTVLLAIEVWEDGRAHNIHVRSGLGYGLDEKAIEAIQQWRFDPSRKNGKPVRVSAQIEVSFRLL